MQLSISTFNRTIEKSNQWLKELKEKGHFASEEEAYSALRAVLHNLRDRLLVTQAAHLASEMPLLIKGMYYDGWKPSATPDTARTQADFLAGVETNLRNARDQIKPETATKAVFKFLNGKISAGEIQDVKSELPKDILHLWQ